MGGRRAGTAPAKGYDAGNCQEGNRVLLHQCGKTGGRNRPWQPDQHDYAGHIFQTGRHTAAGRSKTLSERSGAESLWQKRGKSHPDEP